MMMMSIDSIQSKFRTSLENYRQFKILDGSLLDEPVKQQELKDKTDIASSYNYANTKLVASIKQKNEQYAVLEQFLKDIADDGVANTPLDKAVVISAVKKSGDRDDDGADEIRTSISGIVLKDAGASELVTNKTLSKQQKQQLANAYLEEFKKIKTNIKELTQEEINAGATTKTESFDKLTKDYADTKKLYVEAVKTALSKKIITLKGNNELEKNAAAAKLASFKGNDPIDFKAETNVEDSRLGADANKNGIIENLKTLKAQMNKFKDEATSSFGVSDLDILIKSDDSFQVNSDQLNRVKDSADFKKKIEQTGKTGDSGNPLLGGAKSLEKTLATLKGQKGDTGSAGISLEQLDDFIKENGSNFEAFYKSKKPTNASLSLDNIFNTSTVVDKDSGQTIVKQNDIEGAEETNRETALKTIKPIAISTNKDKGTVSGGVITVNNARTSTQFPSNQEPIMNADGSKLLQSVFNGQPAVFAKDDNGKIYMQFYDRQKAGNGYVLTTGIVEVDPKLAFSEDGKTPESTIGVDMLKPDSKGRKVIDYYVRGFTKDGSTDDDKVLYVARNFADTIDRLPAIRAAQYHARKLADPELYKTKEQMEQEKLDKQTTTIKPNLSLTTPKSIPTDKQEI